MPSRRLTFRYFGSKAQTGWFKCPYCSAVFDVPAHKPRCPRCGTRCNWTNQVDPPDRNPIIDRGPYPLITWSGRIREEK